MSLLQTTTHQTKTAVNILLKLKCNIYVESIFSVLLRPLVRDINKLLHRNFIMFFTLELFISFLIIQFYVKST